MPMPASAALAVPARNRRRVSAAPPRAIRAMTPPPSNQGGGWGGSLTVRRRLGDDYVTRWTGGRGRSLFCPRKQRGELPRTGQLDLLVHLGVGRGDEARHRVVADGDRVALVARALEEVRGGDLVAHGGRNGDHVEALAVAGAVHQF